MSFHPNFMWPETAMVIWGRYGDLDFLRGPSYSGKQLEMLKRMTRRQ